MYRSAVLLVAITLTGWALAASKMTVSIHELSAAGDGALMGTVTMEDTEFGLLVIPDLRGFGPGPHALHVHEVADCGAGADGTLAGAAGDHFDPGKTGTHAGPYGSGHLGDLPNIFVEADGTATLPVLAPRPRADDLAGRALVIHAGADRYNAHGGHSHGKGGARMYCGIIP